MKPLIVAAGAGFLLSVASLVIWLFVNDTRGDVFFGRVNTVATSTIMLEDRHGGTVAVRIATSTTLSRGKEPLRVEDIRVGDFIQVTGMRDALKGIDAQAIRLMKAPKDERRQKQ
jgi:hypothetical protein